MRTSDEAIKQHEETLKRFGLENKRQKELDKLFYTELSKLKVNKSNEL